MSPLPLPSPPLTSPSLHPVSTFSIMTAPLLPLAPHPSPSKLSSSPSMINGLLLHWEGSQTWTNPGPLFTFDLMFCQFLNCFLTVGEFGHKRCSHSCKNARNLTHGGWLCFSLQIWRFRDLLVPFRTVPPPVWPEPCRCCWSRFGGPGLFPSGQPAVCPYPSAAPTDSRSTKRATGQGIIRSLNGSGQDEIHDNTGR